VSRAGKDLVRRWVAEMVGGGDLDVADELFSPDLAASARQWVAPFRASFSDVRMQVVALVAEGDQVAGRFRCSGTHTGTWLDHPPTGRRFDVDEVYFFRVDGGRIVEMWGLEDTAERLRQLGLA
jgi:predicted ester cyclase